jgi:hypothetical protein
MHTPPALRLHADGAAHLTGFHLVVRALTAPTLLSLACGTGKPHVSFATGTGGWVLNCAQRMMSRCTGAGVLKFLELALAVQVRGRTVAQVRKDFDTVGQAARTPARLQVHK